MSKPSIEQARMGTEGIAFCIARTLIERDPSLKAPMRANLRKMWELLEEREDHGAAAARAVDDRKRIIGIGTILPGAALEPEPKTLDGGERFAGDARDRGMKRRTGHVVSLSKCGF